MTHWARFRLADGRIGFGTAGGDHVEEYEGDPFDSPRPCGSMHPRAAVTFLAPCVPSKIIALWNNFHALAVKLGKQPVPRSLYLIKPGTSINGPDQPIRRPATYQGKVVYEGELGIVIRRLCKDVPVERAAEHIFGYTCINDVTAAEVLHENADFAQWCRSKGYDTFGCVGPVIATDFDWPRGRVATTLDGIERQNYPLSDMIIPPERLVSEISHDMTLLPGDVIACGTSVGVGSIRDGSVVKVTIEGIGSLINIFEPR
jgi:2-keto-4-pentenoate hydratase/2-oxohepta-3-ene-1,7-dioic acid hydratase in catechol pathway